MKSKTPQRVAACNGIIHPFKEVKSSFQKSHEGRMGNFWRRKVWQNDLVSLVYAGGVRLNTLIYRNLSSRSNMTGAEL